MDRHFASFELAGATHGWGDRSTTSGCVCRISGMPSWLCDRPTGCPSLRVPHPAGHASRRDTCGLAVMSSFAHGAHAAARPGAVAGASPSDRRSSSVHRRVPSARRNANALPRARASLPPRASPAAAPVAAVKGAGWVSDELPDEVDVVIVGAGIGGLSCAALLGKYGVSVAVAEAHTVAEARPTASIGEATSSTQVPLTSSGSPPPRASPSTASGRCSTPSASPSTPSCTTP